MVGVVSELSVISIGKFDSTAASVAKCGNSGALTSADTGTDGSGWLDSGATTLRGPLDRAGKRPEPRRELEGRRRSDGFLSSALASDRGFFGSSGLIPRVKLHSHI